MRKRADHVAAEPWRPVWWEPTIWPGADFVWSASIPGGHTIAGGDLVLDGRRWPLVVTAEAVSVTAPAAELADVAEGGTAQIFVTDKAGTRSLWLHGRITRGGDYDR